MLPGTRPLVLERLVVLLALDGPLWIVASALVLGFALCATTAAAAIPPEPPPPLALEASELEQLARRKIVVRSDLDGADQGGAGGATGVIDVAAPMEAAIDAILDLPARVGEVTGLRTVSVYDANPTSIGARWELKLLATTSVFHVRYRVDRARGWIRYGLDTERTPNDLVALEGAYQVYAAGAGTRIVYRAITDSGRPVPRWLARWIASESLSQQLEGIRTRAERR